MPYEVLLHREASKELLELPGPIYRRIQAGLIELQTEPRPRRAAKLRGHENLWRLRFGRYRVIFHVDDSEHVVTVVRIALRSEATYRGL